MDDNADLRKLVRMTLGVSGAEIHEAADGEAGLEAVQRLLPDVAVVDVMMPVIDGLELCRRIKGDSALSSVKVILLSARAQQADVSTGMNCGADAYMTKPFKPSELLERVSALTAKSS